MSNSKTLPNGEVITFKHAMRESKFFVKAHYELNDKAFAVNWRAFNWHDPDNGFTIKDISADDEALSKKLNIALKSAIKNANGDLDAFEKEFYEFLTASYNSKSAFWAAYRFDMYLVENQDAQMGYDIHETRQSLVDNGVERFHTVKKHSSTSELINTYKDRTIVHVSLSASIDDKQGEYYFAVEKLDSDNEDTEWEIVGGHTRQQKMLIRAYEAHLVAEAELAVISEL